MDFVGRFHPLLLHLPIGILVFAFLQWCYDIYRVNVSGAHPTNSDEIVQSSINFEYRKIDSKKTNNKKTKPTDLTFALSLGCITAVFSAWSGWVLSEQGGYDQELLDWHKYLGIGTAVGSILLLIIYSSKPSKLLLGLVFTAFMVLLGATGHYGGSLTHGKGFLTKSVKREETKPVVNIQEAHIFNDIIMPIFKRKCVSCHNPEKAKGDLLFDNWEGWQKGGKNGKVLTPGVPTDSPILLRAHLPKENEEHMPPDGKLQLSIGELDFLEWWIKEMKNYDHLVKDLTQNPKVSKYLKSLEGDKFDGITMVSPRVISDLYQSGINAIPVSAKTPWVDVSFSNKTGIKLSLKKLKSIAKNITEIDLSNTDISDRDIKLLKQFENLIKVNLSGCTIGNNAVVNLQSLKNLASLNLYNTQVDNKCLLYLSEIIGLEKVYLWQTNIDKVAAEQWVKNNPSIDIDLGIDESIFGTPKLAGPIIEGKTELFQDSLLISFITSNPRAKISYALSTKNGTTTYNYTVPFHIKESTEISSFLFQHGWTNSDTIKETFVRAKYKPTNITLSTPAHEKYPGDGPSTLIDFTKGSESFGDRKWLGFYESGTSVVLDLGKTQTIESISVGSLIDDRSYIFPPKGISIEISVDGTSFQWFANKNYVTQAGPVTAKTINHILHGDRTQARYVKVDLESQKYNPSWHVAPGAACWLFLDEIVVE
ncbi:MAG: putative membrane protein [Saprospiraceae bacterium]|mgnify:CR=1 FL=1|jgi:uncharacterized membrane protein